MLSYKEPIMSRHELWYFTDCVCGWCYSMAPNIERLLEEFGSRISLRLINYGLCPAERALTLHPQGRERFHKELTRIETRTGAHFGQAFRELIERDGLVFDSHPASKVLVLLRREQPERVLSFLHAVQRSVYEDGHLPDDEAMLKRHLLAFGLSESLLDSLTDDEGLEDETYDDYDLTMERDINIVPTLLVPDDPDAPRFCSGFVRYEVLRQRVSDWLAKAD